MDLALLPLRNKNFDLDVDSVDRPTSVVRMPVRELQPGKRTPRPLPSWKFDACSFVSRLHGDTELGKLSASLV